ncbi:YbjN domain-containing protein [Ostreiculturibacter nitratireducens]|uniref:YbjN domain-containing protein n=1 Tax=Ostreiculturibacter nitratireducens TaxID=3075226 RepID=UPI0031B60DC7
MTLTFARAALAAAFAMAAVPSQAENLRASDPDAVMLAMQKEGFLVTRETADDGTPKLVSRVSVSRFQVYFYGCDKAGESCTSIQFSAGYDLDAPMSALKTNQWNSENRYSRAFIDDEGDPYLKLDLSLFGDGTGQENFGEVLDLWRLLVEDFEDFIDW